MQVPPITLKHVFSSFKWLKRALKLAATLAFAVILFLAYLLFFPSGTKLALTLIREVTPFELKYREVSGILADHIEFNDFSLKSPQGEVQAHYLAGSWDPKAILKGENKLRSLKANNLIVTVSSQATASSSTDNFENMTHSLKKALPFAFEIESLDIEKATIYWPQNEHQLERLILKRASSKLTDLEEIHYEGTFGSFQATLDTAIDAKWDLHFTDNPYLGKYLKGHLKSKGHVLLPKRKFRDPNNQVLITLEAPNATLFDRELNHFAGTIQGTLAKHQIKLSGTIDRHPLQGNFLGALTQDKWQAVIQELHLLHPQFRKQPNSSGELTIQWDAKTIHSNITLLAWQRHPLNLKFQVSRNKKQTLKGFFEANISELKTLAPLLPDLEKLRGQLKIALNLNGSLKKIEYTGDITLLEAKTRLVKWGKKAFLNHLHFKLLPEKNILVTGNGLWGEGKFTINGKGNWQQNFPTFTLALKGNQLLLSDTPEYYIIGDPDLELTFQKGHSTLKGKIFIPEAKIHSLKNTNAVSPSEDVVIISHNKPADNVERANFTDLTTQIECLLGDNISYKGYGLTTKVVGKITVLQQSGQVAKATGKLVLQQAKYRGYGKKFDIEYGQILFTGGPVNDPILDIRAQRKIVPLASANHLETQTITAGIKFAGHLKSPKLTFYSIPAMNDADVISYLIVGKPKQQVNQAQAELLLEAISQLTYLAGNKREDVHFDLAEKLKLDQIGFTRKPNLTSSVTPNNLLEDTALVLGKQLSDRLYMNYSVGLLDSANNVSLRYLLGKNVTVEASTGTQGSSADVLLSFEGH